MNEILAIVEAISKEIAKLGVSYTGFKSEIVSNEKREEVNMSVKIQTSKGLNTATLFDVLGEIQTIGGYNWECDMYIKEDEPDTVIYTFEVGGLFLDIQVKTPIVKE